MQVCEVLYCWWQGELLVLTAHIGLKGNDNYTLVTLDNITIVGQLFEHHSCNVKKGKVNSSFSDLASYSPFVFRLQLRDPQFFQNLNNTSADFFDFSWCIIENDHNFERTEDRATEVKKQTDFRKFKTLNSCLVS